MFMIVFIDFVMMIMMLVAVAVAYDRINNPCFYCDETGICGCYLFAVSCGCHFTESRQCIVFRVLIKFEYYEQ